MSSEGSFYLRVLSTDNVLDFSVLKKLELTAEESLR